MTQTGAATEKSKAFVELKSKLQAVLAPERVEDFLKSLERREIRIRDFDSAVLMHLEGRNLFGQMSSWEQGETREFYLTTIDGVDMKLREKYNKLYRYY